MEFIQNIGKALDRIFRILVDILVAAMFLVVLAQVIWRYFLHHPIVWSEEFARFCMAWITFLGSVIACRSDSLSRVDIVLVALPEKARKVLFVITDVLMLVITVILLRYSITLLNQPGTTQQISAALRLPMNLVYLCMPIGFFGIILQIVIRTIGLFSPGDEEKTIAEKREEAGE